MSNAISSLADTEQQHDAKKRPLVEKWFPRFGYASAEIGTILIFEIISSYLGLYYTDAVGLAPAIVAALMLIVRIIQSVGTPIAGNIIDRTKSRFGLCRPWLLWGLPFLVVLSILTFTTVGHTTVTKVLWAGFTYICLSVVFTMVDTAKGTLVNTISADMNERVVLNSYRSMGSSVGRLVLSGITMPLILFFGNGARGYFTTNLIFAIATIPFLLFAFVACKEHVAVAPDAPKITVKESLVSLMRNSQLLWFVLFNLVATGATLWRVSISTYYYIYSVGRPDLVSPMLMAFTAGQFIPPLIVPFILKYFSKKTALMFGSIMQGVILIAMHFTPYDNVVLIGVLTFMFGVSMMGSIIGFSACSDCIEYDYYRNGRRMPGTVVGAVSLSVAAGMAIGGSLGMFLLGVVGYHKGVVMDMAMRSDISLVVNLIPGIIMIAGIVILIPYKLSNKRMLEIQEANKLKDAAIESDVA